MPAIGTRRVRRNKPTQVWAAGGWVDETPSGPDTSQNGDDALVCDVCGFVAKSAGGLTTHQRSHA